MHFAKWGGDVRKSEQRFYNDFHFMRSEFFTNQCRAGKTNHFIRNRKMPSHHLLISMLVRKGRTLFEEQNGD